MSGRPPGAWRTAAILLPAAIGIAAAAHFAARPDPAFTLRHTPQRPAVEAPIASVSEPPRPADDGLTRFRGALDDLVRGKRKRHVRVALFGDSHTQGGAFASGLRRAFATRYPSGGPGFFLLGSREHPHEGVSARLTGPFTLEPKEPSSTLPRADGVLGLSGVRVRGEAGSEATFRIRTSTQLLWDVCFRGALGATVRVGDRDFTANATTTHALVRSAGALAVHVVSGEVVFCGATVETDPEVAAGVVVDAMGINGARYATFNTWEERDFVSELRRRAPDLVVFEYGTNEASDEPPKAESYREDAERAVARVRRAVPDAACILLGPTDREGREAATKTITATLDRAAASAGCAFWNTFEKMRAHGTIERWKKEGRAQGDGIHLTGSGYEMLAGDLARDILSPPR